MIKNLKQNKKSFSSDSFLEAFRDLGNNAVDSFKNDVVKKTAKDISSAFTGSNISSPGTSGNEFNDFPDIYKKESELEKRYQRQARWQAEVSRKEEHVLFSRADRETKLHVQALQQEIHQLAKATNELAKEVEVASFQMPSEAGTYHINFFEKLRNLIKSLRSQIQESSMWLAEWNKKAKKKNFYWGQFKKSGTNFMLSSDRQVSTQTG